MTKWKNQGLGIQWVTLMVDDPGNAKPTLQGSANWINAFGIKSAYVAPDTKYSMVGGGGSFGTPLQTVIDPRTMKVYYRQEGYSGSFPQLESLAAQNKQSN